MLTTRLQTIRRWMRPLFIGLLLLLILLLWLSPNERTLGQTIKLIYLHGALVWTAIIIFAISLPVNLVALIRGQDNWFAWGKAFIWTAIVIWLVHTLFSMVTTYVAWGVFIAWLEPRTRFTFNLAAVSILVAAVAYLVDNQRFSSLAFVLLAGLTLGLLPGLDFIQHPLNPIGQSPSNTIQMFYGAILAILMAMGGLLAIWLQDRIATRLT